MIRVPEVIRGWLGLCPDRHAVRNRNLMHLGKIYSSIPTGDTFYVNNDLHAEYGKGRLSRGFYIGLAIAASSSIGFFVFFAMTFSFRNAGALFSGLVVMVAMVMFYRDRKKATLEITPEALIIHRPLHTRVVIRRDIITMAEIRQNPVPYPLRYQKAMWLFIMPVLSASILILQYSDLISGEITFSRFSLDLVYFISLVLFFIVFYNHIRIRSGYAENILITTTTKEKAAIYTKNPGEIIRLLEKKP